MDLPPELLRLLEDSSCSIALILGAGCSIEEPTGLKPSKEYAKEVHEKLVRQRILEEDGCADSEDLSAVANAVVEATGDQRELVERLPVSDFRHAEPNPGHLVAVALLIERCVGSILTLNFDMALDNALQRLRVSDGRYSISVVHGPEFHRRMGNPCLIYLHGTAHAPPDGWILTPDNLADVEDGWRQIVTERVVGTPVTVFAGLGTPVGAVVESVQRIREELGEEASVFQVDTDDCENSDFFEAIDITEGEYLQGSWVEFAELMGDYVVELQLETLVRSFEELHEVEDWEVEDLGDLNAQISDHGLVVFGLARGAWLGLDGYTPWHGLDSEWLAEILMAVRFLEVYGEVDGRLTDDGRVYFRSSERGPSSVRLLHGRGRRWSRVELPPSRLIVSDLPGGPSLTVVATGGHGPDPTEMTARRNVVAEPDPASVIEGASTLRVFTFDQLRDHPELVSEVLS